MLGAAAVLFIGPHSCEPYGSLSSGSRHVLGMTAVRRVLIPMGHFRIDGT